MISHNICDECGEVSECRDLIIVRNRTICSKCIYIEINKKDLLKLKQTLMKRFIDKDMSLNNGHTKVL